MRDPTLLTATCLSLLMSLGAAAPAPGDELEQRYERRSGEMAIPDAILDPFAGNREIAPLPPPPAQRIPDNVDHADLDDEVMDETERETYERYLVEEGFKDDPYDHLALDRWDGTSGPEGAEEVDDGGYDDPVEW